MKKVILQKNCVALSLNLKILISKEVTLVRQEYGLKKIWILNKMNASSLGFVSDRVSDRVLKSNTNECKTSTSFYQMNKKVLKHSSVAHHSTSKWYLSSALVLPNLFMGLSYLILANNSFNKYIFATYTTLTYLAAGIQILITSYVHILQTCDFFIGQLGFITMLYVLVSASSFSFHRTAKINVPAHSFDILFSILLLCHVFYMVVSVCFYWVVLCTFPKFKNFFLLLLSIFYMICIFFIITQYDAVYKNQSYLYFTIVPLTALFYIPLRLKFTCTTTHSRMAAVFESIVLLTSIIAGVNAQCEIFGVRYSASSNDHEYYDFYHGQWHFLFAIITVIVYRRVAQVASNKKSDICIYESHCIDQIGLALLFIYSTTVIVSKETKMNIIAAKNSLCVLCLCLCIHSIVTILCFPECIFKLHKRQCISCTLAV